MSFVLGVPVGGDAFTQQFTSDVLSKLDGMLTKSSRLGSGLGKFLILRACFGACPVNHLLRALDFEDGRQLATKVSTSFRHALEDLLQTTTTDEQHTLACLASQRGGLGLKNPTWKHGPAFLASCFTNAASADSLSPAFWEDLSVTWTAVCSTFDLRINFLADFRPLEDFDPQRRSEALKATATVASPHRFSNGEEVECQCTLSVAQVKKR